jgi:hypothetical protein
MSGLQRWSYGTSRNWLQGAAVGKARGQAFSTFLEKMPGVAWQRQLAPSPMQIHIEKPKPPNLALAVTTTSSTRVQFLQEARHFHPTIDSTRRPRKE